MKTYNTIYKNRERLEKFVLTNNIQSPNIMIQVFSATNDVVAMSNIREDILIVLPNAKMVGGLAKNNLFADKKIVREETVISITTFEKTQVFTHIEEIEIGKEFEQGRRLSKRLCQSNSKVMFLFSSLDLTEIFYDDLLEGIKVEHPEIIISGGIIVPKDGDGYVFTEEKIVKHGVALAILNSDDLIANVDANGGWRKIGIDLTVTEVEGKILKGIDGKTPLQIIGEYTSKELSDDPKSFDILASLPFMKKGENIYKPLVIHKIIDGKYIKIDSILKVGDQLCVGYGNVLELFEGANKLFARMNQYPIESAFVYSCYMRERYLSELLDEEMGPLFDAMDVCGLFTDGESAIVEGKTMNSPYNFNILLLSESKEARVFIKTKTTDDLTKPYMQDHLIILDVIRGADKDFDHLNSNLKDIINEKVLELSRQLYTDSLTNIDNRNKMMDDIERQIIRNLALVDIYSFHEINELYGNKVGDNILLQYSKKLENITEKYRLRLYRVNSDVFGIAPTIENANLFIEVMNKISDELSNFKYVDEKIGLEIYVISKIGISQQGGRIFEKASMALKTAKKNGDMLRVYSEEIDKKKIYENNLKWITVMNMAIRDDRIVPYFQPIYHHESKKIDKYEALMRLIDEDGKVISPFFFLDIAIKANLYPKLSRIILSKSFEKIEKTNARISINILLEDIRNNLTMNLIREKLQNSQVAKRTIFEIVEVEGIENFSEVKEFIDFVHECGAKIAIDDFGTGYSNFKYLTELEIDIIKIDGSLIKDICFNENSKNITEIIIDFSTRMGAEVVAEFVAEEDIFQKVESLGVTYSQGYYISEPKQELT